MWSRRISLTNDDIPSWRDLGALVGAGLALYLLAASIPLFFVVYRLGLRQK